MAPPVAVTRNEECPIVAQFVTCSPAGSRQGVEDAATNTPRSALLQPTWPRSSSVLPVSVWRTKGQPCPHGW
ncbi:hypothetical protein E2C01_019542 [Portunus trituberculatus]|uniref:Uncharacterized protein n=1 Tax=Portunus trituberculatus TaxID=210409 RepID=A0A5B7E0Q5_PORTR|nr:hypothetical protein [Portunus trituberculatus]